MSILNYLTDMVIDTLLVVGFGVQHSVIATVTLKKKVHKLTGIDPVSWRGIQSLINVSYIILAACLWREIPIIVWDFTGTALFWVLGGILVASWIWYFQIHLFEYDCGLAFGSSAVLSRLQGNSPPPMEMWKVGSRRWLRFPVHSAFFPMFFAFPRMSLSMLIIAVVGNVNNIYGTILYDKRLERAINKPYKEYQSRTGLLFLPLRKAPAGAADMTLPRPTHWSQPLFNLPGIILGILAGVFYWSLLGVTTLSNAGILKAWGASLSVAVISGIALGLCFSFQRQLLEQLSYARLHTMLATNAALVSAVSIVVWWSFAFLSARTLPILYVSFAMWITVLWIGHVLSAYTLYLLRQPLITALLKGKQTQPIALKAGRS